MKRFLIPHFCLSYLRWPSGRAGPWLWTNHSAARHQASQSEPSWGRISQSVIRWEDVCVGMGWDKARDLACYCLQTIFNWHEILEIIIQKNWDSVISDYIYRAFILYPVVVTSTFIYFCKAVFIVWHIIMLGLSNEAFKSAKAPSLWSRWTRDEF